MKQTNETKTRQWNDKTLMHACFLNSLHISIFLFDHRDNVMVHARVYNTDSDIKTSLAAVELKSWLVTRLKTVTNAWPWFSRSNYMYSTVRIKHWQIVLTLARKPPARGNKFGRWLEKSMKIECARVAFHTACTEFALFCKNEVGKIG